MQSSNDSRRSCVARAHDGGTGPLDNQRTTARARRRVRFCRDDAATLFLTTGYDRGNEDVSLSQTKHDSSRIHYRAAFRRIWHMFGEDAFPSDSPLVDAFIVDAGIDT